MTRTTHSWKTVLGALARRQDLPTDACRWAATRIARGEASQAQIAGFLVGLGCKGETAEELGAIAGVFRDHATRIAVPGTTVDVVGTGGDLAGTVNLSTMAAIVLAGTGVTVVKHGGRSASSMCGAADVLEHLGINLGLEPDQVARVAEKAGITFCLAPLFHPGLRHAAPARKDLGIRTVLNLLAPLVNPADPRHRLVGVADRRLAPAVARVLAEQGCRALVVRGDDGLDELTTTTTSQVWLVRDGEVTPDVVDPVALGISRCRPGDLRGGDVEHNAGVVRRMLAGEPGPVRSAVLLNAAAALVSVRLDRSPLADQLQAAMARCAEAVDSGRAAAVLSGWVEATWAEVGR